MILVDAQAVIGFAAKSRTSAPTTKREIRRLGALALAGGLLIRLVYVPSEDTQRRQPGRRAQPWCPTSVFPKEECGWAGPREKISLQGQAVGYRAFL